MFVTYGAIEKTLSNDEEQEYKELLQETEQKQYINKPTINKSKILSVFSMIVAFVGVSFLIANNSGSSTIIPATNMIYNSSELFEELDLSYPTINTISIPELVTDLQSAPPTISEVKYVELQSISPTIIDIDLQSALPTIIEFPDVELQSAPPTISEVPDVELQSLSPTIMDIIEFDLQSAPPTIDLEYN